MLSVQGKKEKQVYPYQAQKVPVSGAQIYT